MKHRKAAKTTALSMAVVILVGLFSSTLLVRGSSADITKRDALGPFNHYNGILFNTLEGQQADIEGAVAVGKTAKMATKAGESYDVGGGSTGAYNLIGCYENPNNYPTLLLNGTMTVGRNNQGKLNSVEIYGGPFVINEAYKDKYDAGDQIRQKPKFSEKNITNAFFADAEAATRQAVRSIEHSGATGEFQASQVVGWGGNGTQFNDYGKLRPSNLQLPSSASITADQIAIINIRGSANLTIDVLYVYKQLIDDFELVIFNFPDAQNVTFSGNSIWLKGVSSGQLNTGAVAGTAQNQLVGEVAAKVVYSFPSASDIIVQNCGVVGSILAPDAYVEGRGGSINGMLVADTLKATGGFELHAFSMKKEIFDFGNEDDEVDGSVTLTKTESGTATANSSGNLLAGAVFALYKYDDATGSYKAYNDGNGNVTATTGRYGTLTITGLPAGRYELRETKAPDGYEIGATSRYRFEITLEKPDYVFAANAVTNDRMTLDASFTKRGADAPHDPLEGAAFTLYKSQQSDTGTLNMTVVDTYTTGSNGLVKLENLTEGFYYLLETSAPAGYEREQGEVYQLQVYYDDTLQRLALRAWHLDVDLDQYDTENPTDIENKNPADVSKTALTIGADNSFVVYNDKAEDPTGRLLLMKTDTAGTTPLSGAVFRLEVWENNAWVYYNSYTTNAFGLLEVDDLPAGNYRITETRAPDGYMLSGYQRQFTIDPVDDAGNELKGPLVELAVTNEPYTASINLTKVDATTLGGSPSVLRGAKFHLYRSTRRDDTLTFALQKNPDSVTPGEEYYFDSKANGNIALKGLMPGYYYLVEALAPDGYLLPENVVWQIQVELVTTNGTQSARVTAVNKLTLYDGFDWDVDELNAGYEGITVEPMGTANVNIPNDPSTGDVLLHKTDEGGSTLLAGAEFTLYKKVQTGQNTFEYREAGVYTTNAFGLLEINNLRYGEYKLVETKAPDGYTLSSPVFSKEFTIGEDTGAGEAMAYEFTAENPLATTNVTLTKVSSDDASIPVPGAKFALYRSSRDSGGAMQFTQVGSTLTTGNDGKLTLQGLTQGYYYLTETKAPDGFALSDAVYQIEVKADGNSGLTTSVHLLTNYDITTGTGDKTPLGSDDITITNDPVGPDPLGMIMLQKWDDDGNSLAGATFQLWAHNTNSDIPDWDITQPLSAPVPGRAIITPPDVPAGDGLLDAADLAEDDEDDEAEAGEAAPTGGDAGSEPAGEADGDVDTGTDTPADSHQASSSTQSGGPESEEAAASESGQPAPDEADGSEESTTSLVEDQPPADTSGAEGDESSDASEARDGESDDSIKEAPAEAAQPSGGPQGENAADEDGEADEASDAPSRTFGDDVGAMEPIITGGEPDTQTEEPPAAIQENDTQADDTQENAGTAAEQADAVPQPNGEDAHSEDAASPTGTTAPAAAISPAGGSLVQPMGAPVDITNWTLINGSQLVSNDLGLVAWHNLPEGKYLIEEVSPPAGYEEATPNIIDDIEISAGDWHVYRSMENKAEAPDTASLTLLKTDGEGNTLPGAGFTLYRSGRTVDGQMQLTRVDDTLISASDGKLSIDDLEEGYYYLLETTTPTGFEPLDYVIQIVVQREGATLGVKAYSIEWDQFDMDDDLAALEDADSIPKALLDYDSVNNEYEVVNTKIIQYGDLTVQKYDKQTGAALSGVKFHLYEADDSFAKIPGGRQHTATTNRYGRASFSHLPVGKYLLEEELPAGYDYDRDSIDNEIKSWQVIIKASGVTDVLGYSVPVANVPKTLSLIFEKVDADDSTETLPDAEFNLYKSQKNDDGTLDFHFIKSYRSSDPGGQIQLDGLSVGNYYLVETYPPDGYWLEHTYLVVQIQVTLDGTGEPQAAVRVLDLPNAGDYDLDDLYGIPNEPQDWATSNILTPVGTAPGIYGVYQIENEKEPDVMGRYIIQKQGDNKAGLPGAVFTLEYKAEQNGPWVYHSRQSTNTFGYAVFNDLREGWYRATETTPPSGYTLADDGSGTREFEIKGTAGVTEVTYVEPKPVVNKSVRSSVQAFKAGADDVAVPLEGTVFTLYKWANKPPSSTQSGGMATIAPLEVETSATGADGLVTFTGLEHGWYTLREVLATYGYNSTVETVRDANGNVISEDEIFSEEFNEVAFQIKGDGAYSHEYQYFVVNPLLKGNVEVSKVFMELPGDDANWTYDPKPLARAGFKLYQRTDGGYEPYDDGRTYYTDATGKLTISDLPVGRYRLEEVSRPAQPGYEYEGEGSVMQFSVTPNADSTDIEVISDFTVTNYVRAVPTGPTASVDIIKRNSEDTTQSLAGAWFRLYKNNGGSWQEVVQDRVYFTNGEGKLTIGGLTEGEYRIVETKAPASFGIDDTNPPTVQFTLGFDSGGSPIFTPGATSGGDISWSITNGTLVYTLLNDPDPQVPGLEMYKIDGSTYDRQNQFFTPLPGAAFRLYRSYTGEEDTYNLYATLSSNAAGMITLPFLNEGYYRLVEEKAPDGYELKDGGEAGNTYNFRVWQQPDGSWHGSYNGQELSDDDDLLFVITNMPTGYVPPAYDNNGGPPNNPGNDGSRPGNNDENTNGTGGGGGTGGSIGGGADGGGDPPGGVTGDTTGTKNAGGGASGSAIVATGDEGTARATQYLLASLAAGCALAALATIKIRQGTRQGRRRR